MTGAHLERLGIRRVDDVGHRLEDLDEATEARNGLLEGLRKIEDVLDRRGEHRDIERVGRKVGGLHLALRDQPSAIDEDERVETAHHAGDGGLIATHRPIHVDLRDEIRVVALAETGALDVLRGEALHHTDTAEGILDTGIHV